MTDTRSMRRLHGRSALAALVALLASGPAVLAQDDAPDGAESAAAQVVFTLEDNARCQNLSPGGKMTLVSNSHPQRGVRVRLVRHFAGAPQPGRVDALLVPGEAPRQLGCSEVDGRPQEWKLVSAAFDDGVPPAQP